MNTPQIFNFEQNQVRTVLVNDEPYFVGKDVADVLGYSNSRDALRNHVDPEDKFVLTSRITTLELMPNRGLVGINESGVYALIFGSKLPNAKKFKRWVTSEVLPAIRKTGSYTNVPKNFAEALRLAADLEEEKLLLEQKVAEYQPKALFADSVSASKTSILVGDLAKLIKQNGVDIGAGRLFNWLRDKGFLIKRKGTDWNMPTQKSMELGLFEVKETVVSHSDGHTSINKTPKVTGKGQVYFVNKFLNISMGA